MARSIRTTHLASATVAAVLLASALAATPAHALTTGECAALAGLAVADTTITSTAVVAASGGLPEYCRVQGRVDTEINFELRLPTTTWNGKFYHGGGGGFVGSIPTPTTPLIRGYAVVGTDTGHTGSAIDGSWALNRPDRQLNWGHRAIHVVTVAAKRIVAAAYRQAPRYSYFEGCSNGGRQAAMEAQRYPTDFDGIIAAAPALDITGLMLGFNWNEQAVHAAPIPPAKLTLIANAVVAQCDAKDGLVDGLVDNPRRCRFDPTVLTCPGAADGPNCLTPAQVEAATKVYAGPVTSAGEQLHPGFPPGAEDGGTGWELWISGPGVEGAPLQFWFEDQFLRYFIFGESFSSLNFDFDTDVPAVTATSDLFDATNPDLSTFQAAGGKLLMWHGWADHALTADRTIQYHNDVARTMGNKNTIKDFVRLFLAPGMHHCASGPGLNQFDALTALENWVEGGLAPDAIIASHAGPGVARTRPLCAYPRIAVYDGTGDPDDARSFTCRERGLGYPLKGLESGQ
jgi:feruloyl esterase